MDEMLIKSCKEFRKRSLNKRAKRLRRETKQQDKMLKDRKCRDENANEKRVREAETPAPKLSMSSAPNKSRSNLKESRCVSKGGSGKTSLGDQHTSVCSPQMPPDKVLTKAAKRNAFPLVEKPGRVGRSRLKPRWVRPVGCELWEYRLNRPDRPFFESRRGSNPDDNDSHFDEWERREDSKNKK